MGSLPQNRITSFKEDLKRASSYPTKRAITGYGLGPQVKTFQTQIGPPICYSGHSWYPMVVLFFQRPANLTHLCVQQSNNKIYTKCDSPKVRVSIHCPQHTAGLVDQHWPVVDHPQLRGVSLGSPCFNSYFMSLLQFSGIYPRSWGHVA